MPRKPNKIRASAVNAGRLAANARKVERVIDDGMRDSVNNVASDAELIYQAAAPRRSHRLARGIRAVPIGDQAIVTATAVDPGSGFDYVAVTRFGHKKRIIRPVTKTGRPRQSRTVTRGPGGRFTKRSAAALSFFSRGQQWLLPSVRGFRPKVDWVDAASSQIDQAAGTEMDRTGNEIAVRWSS